MKYGVYIKINNNAEVTEINSSLFIEDLTGEWIKIDEGTGDRFAHAQNNYLDGPLYNEEGAARYKYIEGKIVKINEEENQ